MSESDWTRPEKDSWHWLRLKSDGELYAGSYSRVWHRWQILSGTGRAEDWTPVGIADYFDYIAPIEEPAP